MTTSTTLLTVALSCLLVAPARGQLTVEADGRGVVSVSVGGTPYLTDLGVSVVKPGWTGELANQRAADPSEVSIREEGATTSYIVPLRGPMPGVLITRVVRETDQVRLEYQVIPDDGAEIEANFRSAARNIPNIDVLPVQGINVYDIMRRKTLVLTKAAVDALQARFK